MSFLTPLAFALAALALPIVLLYMLRLRRTEMPISSTFLWQQLVRDREANAPWQRLRFSWLLLLQLLILAALVLSLARPFVDIKTITTGRIVLLLDASASMQATDVQPSRFAQAREIGLDLVDTLGADDTMTVIRVADVPEVLAAASRDKLVLREAIREAQPSDASANWIAAMTLAAAGAVGVDELKIVIVSDGGLPPDVPPVPGDVRFVPVGAHGANLAISALATASLPGQPPQLFARISNYSDVETDVILDVRLDDSDVIYTARRYTVPARGHVDLFEIELPQTFDTLTAQLTLPSRTTARDYLSVDNRAFAVRDRSGAGRVLLVTEDNFFLQQIFRSLRGVEAFQIAPSEALPADTFDLYVFDGVLPEALPDGDLLLVNPPSSTEFFTVGPERQVSGAITVRKDDPRTRNLDPYIETVNLRSFRELEAGDWATALLQVDGYPLVVAGEVGVRQIVVLAFDARYPNTDMVLQPSWPILIAQLAAWFSPPRITDVLESLPPGAPVSIRFVENADEAVVVRPDGKTAALPSSASEVVFADTLTPGLYRVELRKDGETIKTEQFAVNLFDPAESQIEPRPSVVIGTVRVSRDAREETGRREFWPWIAALALLLLAVEWWVYHRSLRRIPRVTLVGFGIVRDQDRGRLLAWRRWLNRRRSRRSVRSH